MRSCAVLVIGHRGSRAPGPENSPLAVAAAVDAGAAGVELDVRWGADGALRCAHDPLPTGPGAAPPLLHDVLAVARGLVVLEVKNVPGQPDYDAPVESVARELVRVLPAAAAFDVVVSSFDWLAIEAVRSLDGPPTAFLAPPGVALGAAINYASGARHSQVHVHLSDVLAAGAAGVVAAHEAGLGVAVWTITDLEVLPTLASWQVDGAICDDPAAAVRRLAPGPS